MQSKIGKLGGYINSGSHEGPRPVALLCLNFKVGQKPKVCKKRPKKVNIMSGATTYSLQFTLSHFFQNLSLHSSFLGTLPSFRKFLGPMRSMQIADALVAASQLLLDGC